MKGWGRGGGGEGEGEVKGGVGEAAEYNAKNGPRFLRRLFSLLVSHIKSISLESVH